MLEVRFCYNLKRTPHCKATRNRSKRKEVPHSGVSCIRPASLPLRAVFQWRRVRFRGAVSLRFPPPHCAVIAFGISVKRTPPCGITRKAVHIIHMMGEEIVYGGIVVYSLRDCKIFFNFFYNTKCNKYNARKYQPLSLTVPSASVPRFAGSTKYVYCSRTTSFFISSIALSISS